MKTLEKSKLKKWVSKNKIKDTLDYLSKVSDKDIEMENSLVLIASQYNQWRRDKINNTIYLENKIEKIKLSLLEYIDSLESLTPNQNTVIQDDLDSTQPQPSEIDTFILILKSRAKKVRKVFGQVRIIFSDRFYIKEKLAEFEELHKLHIEIAKQENFSKGHEINKEIQKVIAQLQSKSKEKINDFKDNFTNRISKAASARIFKDDKNIDDEFKSVVTNIEEVLHEFGGLKTFDNHPTKLSDISEYLESLEGSVLGIDYKKNPAKLTEEESISPIGDVIDSTPTGDVVVNLFGSPIENPFSNPLGNPLGDLMDNPFGDLTKNPTDNPFNIGDLQNPTESGNNDNPTDIVS